MIAITEYHFSNFGLTLPEACVEVTEVQATKHQQYYDNETQNQKNTVVRIQVWVDESARTEGKQPLEQTEKFIDLDIELTNNLHKTALTVLLPDATIKA